MSLTKKGNNYIGLCPFHQDTTPSFTISPIKKIYKCFSRFWKRKCNNIC
ncbi:CHC2 zinc finger domain-containing protein [Mycoplasmopsis cynos]|nr:CHC2 zinc finger domain-containing protein [Mycoplasmopsis cynos]UWV83393.1 CHC2 zinc finger domain-containing protein [Mycoplasmopsis cynos]